MTRRLASAAVRDNDDSEPAAMERVRQLHTQLNSVVGTLNDKVSTILKKQESEFLRAYRAHMYSVQKELATWKAKANDAELQLMKNAKIRQLEGACAGWRYGVAIPASHQRVENFSPTGAEQRLKLIRQQLYTQMENAAVL